MKLQPHWHVYVLRNPDGKLYIGQTEDLERRISQHNDPTHTLTRTTKRFRGPWNLCWASAALSSSDARRLENKLKRQKGGDGFYKITGLSRQDGQSTVNPAAAGS